MSNSFSSVDSLPNKKQELMSVINNAPCKPKIIALTEIKYTVVQKKRANFGGL